jgi:hypothetical protein
MKHAWQIDEHDIAYVRAFVDQYRDDDFVRARIATNVDHPPTAIARPDFWRHAVGCLLTTQARSGPDSPAARFFNTEPFPFSLEFCAAQPELEAAAVEKLRAFPGMRRYHVIARQVATNYARLTDGLWAQTEAVLATLFEPHTANAEREAASYIAAHFHGFGPKQSRNLLQGLGLTQSEIPIDSRILKWLNAFGFPLALSAWALSDEGYYNLVGDGIQALCEAAGILPCVLDAAIFTSFDKGAWTDENVVW